MLCDSPFVVGKLREWQFTVDQTPIRIAYLPLPYAKNFDEKLLLREIRKIVPVAKDLLELVPARGHSQNK